MFKIIEAIREYLKGKKTYLVAAIAIAIIVIMFIQGRITLGSSLVLSLAIVGLVTLRAAIAKVYDALKSKTETIGEK